MGKSQLDDVFDPMAKRRDYAEGVANLANEAGFSVGQAANKFTERPSLIFRGAKKGAKKAMDTALEPNAVSNVIESAYDNKRALTRQKRRLKRMR